MTQVMWMKLQQSDSELMEHLSEFQIAFAKAASVLLWLPIALNAAWAMVKQKRS